MQMSVLLEFHIEKTIGREAEIDEKICQTDGEGVGNTLV